jgi:hypothetical protein
MKTTKQTHTATNATSHEAEKPEVDPIVRTTRSGG